MYFFSTHWPNFAVTFQFLSEQPDHNMIGNSLGFDEEDWCVGCGWDQYGDFEQQQAVKFHANESPIAAKLQQVCLGPCFLFVLILQLTDLFLSFGLMYM